MTGQPSYAKTYPFDTDEQKAGQSEWRRLAGAFGDGIVNDTTGNSFAATASPSDRTVVVTLDELRMRGIHFEGVDDTRTITLPAVDTGYIRCDRIVAHYDPSDRSIVIEILEGSPVLSTAGPAPVPVLTQAAGGVWEMSLYRFTGGNTAASTLAKVDERAWVGDYYIVGAAAQLPGLACSVNSLARVVGSGHEWAYELVSGTPTWVDLDDPPWTAWNATTGLSASYGPGTVISAALAPPAVRVRRGRVEFRGSVARTNGSAMGPGGLTLGTLPLGFPKPEKTIALPVTTTGFTSGWFCGRIEIGPSGSVAPYLSSSAGSDITWLSLDGVEFAGVVA